VTALGTIVAIFGRWIVPHAHTMTLAQASSGKASALIILLPILRVVSMLIMFLRERDYLFGMIPASCS